MISHDIQDMIKLYVQKLTTLKMILNIMFIKLAILKEIFIKMVKILTRLKKIFLIPI